VAATRVLVVDDSEADQFIARLRLQDVEPGVNITQAFDGAEAMALVEAQGETAFDLILLDVNMPRMNGRAFLEAYSRTERASPPVVVVLTSSADAQDRELFEEFACVGDYLVKPLDPDWVERTLR